MYKIPPWAAPSIKPRSLSTGFPYAPREQGDMKKGAEVLWPRIVVLKIG